MIHTSAHIMAEFTINTNIVQYMHLPRSKCHLYAWINAGSLTRAYCRGHTKLMISYHNTARITQIVKKRCIILDLKVWDR